MAEGGDALIKKIDQIHRKNGFDETFITAALFHFKKIAEHKVNSQQDVCNLIISKFFLDKIDEIYDAKRFTSQVTEESNWPVRVMPVECFGDTKFPDSYRLNCFYECLKMLDVLDCRVAEVNPFDYQLRVIHKYGVTAILDDLNIMVTMPKTERSMSFLEKDLLLCELIRVKVTKITEKNEIYVTAEEDNSRRVKLGRLPDEFLPPYVLNPHVAEKFPSYAKYLSSMPQFKNPILLNDIYTDFGIDPYATYSFYPKFKGSNCDESKTGQTLLRESKKRDANQYAIKATRLSKGGNFTEALDIINKAIDLCPPDDNKVYGLYDIRGNIHCALKKPKISRDAFRDWIKAYTLDPKDYNVKRNLSIHLFKLANKCYGKKEYKNAFFKAKNSLKFKNDNDEDLALVDYLKKKHAEIFYEEESLSSLQEKQIKIVTELKKIEIKKEKK